MIWVIGKSINNEYQLLVVEIVVRIRIEEDVYELFFMK